MSCMCGRCAGIEPRTPNAIFNPPGLRELSYRVGRHDEFLASLLVALPHSGAGDGGRGPLAALATHTTEDYTNALLDGWAVLLDVLTFHSERLANEGYLRTATHERSLRALAALVGYRPRLGVAASTYLAFELERNARLRIEAGQPAQSVPGPGEQPQTFETSAPLEARAEWNLLRAATSGPQEIDVGNEETFGELYLAGDPRLRPGDPMLLVDRALGFEAGVFCRVGEVEPQPDRDRTRITLRVAGSPATLAAFKRLLPERRPAVADPAAARARVGAVVEMALAEPPSPGAQATGRVLGLMHALEGTLAMRPAPEELAALLERDYIPALRVEERQAARFRRLHPWIGSLAARLEAEARALRAPIAAGMANGRPRSDDDAFGVLGPLLAAALKRPSRPPADPADLVLDRSVLDPPSDAAVRVIGAKARLADPSVLYHAWGDAPAPGASTEVYALRVTATPFGQAAPPKAEFDDGGLVGFEEWRLADDERPDTVFLATEAAGVVAPGVAVIERGEQDEGSVVIGLSGGSGGGRTAGVFLVKEAEPRARAQYGLTGRCIELRLDRPWFDWPLIIVAKIPPTIRVLRESVVHTAAERLQLADVPRRDPIEEDSIELETTVDGLEAGRWIVVGGDRVLDDDPESPLAGVTLPAAELAMIAAVRHVRASVPGAKPRSILRLAVTLAYRYRRDTVRVWGNVVGATQGETQAETLGNGDGGHAGQTFTLSHKPLTHVPAATAEGARSTLVARVDGLAWREAPDFTGLGPSDRAYVTSTREDGTTVVTFGDGIHGQRLPTGTNNVTAGYRSGMGRGGNLPPERITQLGARPLGLKGVVNPLPAGGGADPDGADELRRRAPLGVTALDRLVSVRDYEDFAKSFAGIGKASATELPGGRRTAICVTVAAVGDAELPPTSSLLADLRKALRGLGDPQRRVLVLERDLQLLAVGLAVAIDPDRAWSRVEPQIRAALLARFGFDARELAQDVTSSEVLATVQSVPGVTWARLELLDVVVPGQPSSGLRVHDRVPAHPAGVTGQTFSPAQLLVLRADVPATILLRKVTP